MTKSQTTRLVNAIEALGAVLMTGEASIILTDAYFTGGAQTTLAAVINELKAQLGGATSTTFDFTAGSILTDNAAIYACLEVINVWAKAANADELSAQAFIPVSLTSLLESDGTNVVAALGKATTPTLDMAGGDADSGLVVTWAAANQDAVIFPLPLPPDLKVDADVVIHLRAKCAVETPVIDADMFVNEGDTKVEAASAALGAAYAEKIITLTAANVGAGAQTLTVELTPGAHATGALVLSAIWVEYTRIRLTS